MSETSPIVSANNPMRAAASGGPRVAPRVEGAIARASARTGIDFGYLFAQAKVESALDVDAKAGTSSAAGLFQFIESTWLDVMSRHGGAHGYGQYAAQIQAGPDGPRVADPLMRGQILALRNDPQAASLMAGALAQDNRDALLPVLGREPESSELYLAHFLGSGGASRFLEALGQRPDAPAAAEFGKAARANRSIFYTPGGGARSFAGVMGLLRGKIEAAMPAGEPAALAPEDRVMPIPLPSANFASVVATRGRPAWAPSPPLLSAPALRPGAAPRASMSDMLQHAFALGSGDTASADGDHARRAYERLKAFGL